ncbi:hypothetical protein VTI28DRAFT_8330 [Corynascus sepedonium]
MNSTSHPSNLIEYVWPCGHHENVDVQKAPGIPFVRGQFSLPVAKSPEEFTEEERLGVPGRRKCCRCWATCSLFKPLEACEECDHPFTGCQGCMIVDSSGSREIATLDRRPVGEFDQSPEYWRCNTCEHINSFDSDGPINGFLAPMVSDYMDDMECRKCGGSFTVDSWVISPFWVYLGTWNGRVVAEGGPWHWSLEWHRDCASEQHTRDDCYAARKNGRRRRENPCINKHFAAEAAQKTPKDPTVRPPIPPILVVDTDNHSLPPPSAGLTPFPGENDYDSDRGTAPEFEPQTSLQPDNQTVGTGGFTIGDYAGDDYEAGIELDHGERGLEVLDDDEEPDLGSYYDAPAEDDELLDGSEHLENPQHFLDENNYEPDPASLEEYPGDCERDLGDNPYAPLEEDELSAETEPPPLEQDHNIDESYDFEDTYDTQNYALDTDLAGMNDTRDLEFEDGQHLEDQLTSPLENDSPSESGTQLGADEIQCSAEDEQYLTEPEVEDGDQLQDEVSTLLEEDALSNANPESEAGDCDLDLKSSPEDGEYLSDSNAELLRDFGPGGEPDDADLEDDFLTGEEDEDAMDDESEFSYVDDGHTTIPRNTFAILDTPAAAAYNPPGMTHDTSWDSEEEEDDNDGPADFEGEGIEGEHDDLDQQSFVDGDGERSLDDVGSIDGEDLSEGEREFAEEEEPELVEEFEAADEEDIIEDGDRGLDNEEFAEGEGDDVEGEEEAFDEEPLEGDQSGEEFLDGEDGELLDEEGLDGERGLDEEEGDFAVEENAEPDDGEFAEEDLPEDGEPAEEFPEEGEFDSEMGEDGERGLDEEFLPDGEGDSADPGEEFLPEDGEILPEDEGELPPDGDDEFLPEGDDNFPEEGDEFEPGAEEFEEEGERGLEDGDAPEVADDFPTDGDEFEPDAEEFEDGERGFDEEQLAEDEAMEGEEFADGDELTDGEPLNDGPLDEPLDEEFADGEPLDDEFADGEPLNDEADGEFPPDDFPQDDLAAGEFPEDGYVDDEYGDGERDIGGDFGGQQMDDGYADSGFADDGQPYNDSGGPGYDDGGYPVGNYDGAGYPDDDYTGDRSPADNYHDDDFANDQFVEGESFEDGLNDSQFEGSQFPEDDQAQCFDDGGPPDGEFADGELADNYSEGEFADGEAGENGALDVGSDEDAEPAEDGAPDIYEDESMNGERTTS